MVIQNFPVARRISANIVIGASFIAIIDFTVPHQPFVGILSRIPTALPNTYKTLVEVDGFNGSKINILAFLVASWVIGEILIRVSEHNSYKAISQIRERVRPFTASRVHA